MIMNKDDRVSKALTYTHDFYGTIASICYRTQYYRSMGLPVPDGHNAPIENLNDLLSMIETELTSVKQVIETLKKEQDNENK